MLTSFYSKKVVLEEAMTFYSDIIYFIEIRSN